MRKHTLHGALIALFCMFATHGIRADDLQLTQITTALLKGIQQTGKKRIAVADFVDLDGRPSRLGKYVAEELSVELTQSANGIEVVDRAHLQAILHEHQLKSEGLLDPETTRELGKLAGVDIVVTGSLTDVGDSIRVLAKALSTDSARIVAASSETLAKTPQIATLLSAETSSSGNTADSATAPQPANESGPQKASTLSPTTRMEHGVRIQLDRCERHSSQVICPFTAEALDKDKDFGMVACNRNVPPNSIVDGKGIFQEALWFAIGSSRTREGEICDHVSTTLVQNVPVEGEIAFGAVAPEVDRIALLTLVFGFDNGDNFTLKFRNVLLKTP